MGEGVAGVEGRVEYSSAGSGRVAAGGRGFTGAGGGAEGC